MAAADLAKLRRAARSGDGRPETIMTYGSAALSTALLLFVGTQQEGGLSGPQSGIFALLLSAAGYRYWLDRQPGWGEGDGEGGGAAGAGERRDEQKPPPPPPPPPPQ